MIRGPSIRGRPYRRRIDRVTATDYDELHALLGLAFGYPVAQPSVFTRVVEADDGLMLVQRRGGRMVAAAGAIGFGTSAWIGGVAVHPDARGERLGEWLTAAAIDAIGPRERVLLLATAAGRRSYERLGFEPGEAYRSFAPPCERATPSARGPRVRAATAADHDAILALDAAATGEDRSGLLRGGLAGALVTDDLRAASVDLSLATPHVVASTPEAGAAVLEARLGTATRAVVPAANQAAVDVLDASGFTETPGPVRMHRGAPVAWDPQAVWGTASLFCG